jgi:hypothetical protein
MKKYYLINGNETEVAYFSSDEKAFEEAEKRNKRDRNANWKAYDESGWVVYSIAVCC